ISRLFFPRIVVAEQSGVIVLLPEVVIANFDIVCGCSACSMASSHSFARVVLELALAELASPLCGVSARGAGSGTLGGVREWSIHQPQMQVTSGNGLVTRCFLLDCCLLSSAMISSTGRSAGHDSSTDCANIPVPTITTTNVHPIGTESLYRQHFRCVTGETRPLRSTLEA